MNPRRLYIQIGMAAIAILFAFKLFCIQVLDPNYRLAAESNIVRRQVEYPLRGIMVDRNNELVVGNQPVFDVMVIPKDLAFEDTAKFCETFGLTLDETRKRLKKARRYSRFRPSILLNQIDAASFARISDRLTEYSGIYPVARTARYYPYPVMANALGYVREVDQRLLDADSTKYYSSGDLIGKKGLEKYYERQLRGRRGVKYVMTNVKGQIKGAFQGGKYDTIPEVGQTLKLTVDIKLQQYAEQLMQNKKGSVVAIEPKTGEILVMVSAPCYDPNMLAGGKKEVSRNFNMLYRDELKPLFSRATMALYPPGSTFKTLNALVGMQTGALDTNRTYFHCIKSLVGCHNHTSPLNVFGSIQHSCNPFYYQAFKKYFHHGEFANDKKPGRAIEYWKNLAHQFGLGVPLGIDLPVNYRGRIPGNEYYTKRLGPNWKLPNVQSIAIGQGEVAVLPTQLANQAVCIANRGWYYTPHLVKEVGEGGKPLERFTDKHTIDIEPAYFDHIARAMEAVVRAGTARRAFINDIKVCGKTGTAQNPHGKDHSIFMGFAPLDDPQIAVAVYVENAGFGGTWAAPIASLIMEKHVRDTISHRRKYVEDYVLKGVLIEKKEEEATVTQN